MYLEYLYQAANSEHGICIATSNVTSMKEQLIQARKATGDANLANLSFRVSPINPSHLWIIKNPKNRPANSKIEDLDLDL